MTDEATKVQGKIIRKLSRLGDDGKVIAESITFAVESLSFTSRPPAGCYKITNIWRDQNGNFQYEYDTEPTK